MPSNLLLLLPLLGGYAFIHICFRFRYRAQALSGHRLIFEASIAGLLFLVPSRALILLIAQPLRCTSWFQPLWGQVTGGTGFVGTLILALFLAPSVAALWNVADGYRWHRRFRKRGQFPDWIPKKYHPRSFRSHWETCRIHELDRAIKNSSNDLWILLHRAAQEAAGAERRLAVALSMKDDKVYVGWVTRSPNLRPDDQHVSIYPLISGYRDGQTKEVIFTTDYPTDEEELSQAGLRPEDFIVVLPLAEILTVRLFDRDFYQSTFAPQRRRASPASPS